MSNNYFVSDGTPGTGTFAASAAMRTQFSSVEDGFDKLPTLTGNGSKAVVINSGGTALTVTTGTLALAGNFATTGAFNTTLIAGATVSLTLPLVSGTLATLAGTETLTNKTISGASNTITNVSLTSGVTATLPVANGGLGVATLAANAVILGNGTSAVQTVAPGASGQVLMSDGSTWASSALPAAGTVTTLSVVSTNGFAGSVANATTTPAITISTSVTGLLKGNGTAISAAVAGTDYIVPGGALGTPASGTATNLTGTAAGLTAGAVAVGGITGLGANVATALAVAVGSAGAFLTFNGAGGTPASLTLTNATGLPVAGGGTGRATLTANYVLLGDGTSAVQMIAPSTSGNVLTSNGTTWASATPPTGYTQVATYTNSGTPTTITFTGLTSNDIIIYINGLTVSGTRNIDVSFSTDGTNFSTARRLNPVAVEFGATATYLSSFVTGLALGKGVLVSGLAATTTPAALPTSSVTVAAQVVEFYATAAITAIRLSLSSDTFTGTGVVTLYGR